MSNFSILMFIFGGGVLLIGLYMYTGHKVGMLSWRAAYKNLTIEGWKNVGKWTMIVSIFIFLLGIIGIIFNFE